MQRQPLFGSIRKFSSKNKDDEESLLDKNKDRIKNVCGISLDELDKNLDAQLNEMDKELPVNKDKQQVPFPSVEIKNPEEKNEKPIFRRVFGSKSESKKSKESGAIIGWKSAIGILAGLGLGVCYLQYLKYLHKQEKEKDRIIQLGKSKIGGEWELVNMEGKLEKSVDLQGSWLLIYFGFTHCPDICPEEIEKMVKITETLEKRNDWAFLQSNIIPIFISVDPDRDSVARVKKYCQEFSPKIRGYTGNLEQVEKVCKTFRVYRSKGPGANGDINDYIVDHTVIMYLVNPNGKFDDYYGNNRNAEEIAENIAQKICAHKLLSAKKSRFFSL